MEQIIISDTVPVPEWQKALPEHIAIIMDGNGRWAQKRGLSRSDGHRAGVKAAKNIVSECRRLGIPFLTLYTFSKENWGRPHGEVFFLFQLLVSFLKTELPEMVKQDIRLNLYGDPDTLPVAAQKALKHAMKKTSACSSMSVNLALNYSGREEILGAIKKIISSGIRAEEITEENFRNYLFSVGQPDPDLTIRTGGELRLSNFLTFQGVYSELYFTKTLWPDFNVRSLHTALQNYAGRKRRFGLTQEQTS